VYHNTVRFERPDGTAIQQNPDDTAHSSLTYTTSGSQVSVSANLSNAFTANTASVQEWIRNLEYVGDTLRIQDGWTVAAGVRAVVQLQVPVLPVLQPDGTLLAGSLLIVPLQEGNVTISALPAEFSQGYRIDFTPAAGNTFAMELRAQ
jgi:hypothetical protein